MTLASEIVDPGQDNYTLTRINWGDGTVDDNPSAAAHTYTDDGIYNIIAFFTEDNAAATVREVTIAHTVARVDPVVTIAGPDSVDEGTAYSLSLSAVDQGDDTIESWTVNWGDGADEEIDSNPSAATHTYADDGNYTISARATNEDGTYDAASSVLVSVADISPQITLSTDPAPSDEASPVILASEIVDPGQDNYTLTRINWGDGTVKDNPSATAHTYADDSKYDIIAFFTEDNAAATVREVTIAHTVAKVDPVVTIAGAGNVDEGSVYSLSLSAVDQGDDTIESWTINWGDGADETITGNPSAAAHTYVDDGNYTISARATNEDGTYDAEGNVLVAVNNLAPDVIAGDNQETAEGSAVTFTGSFADPGADTHTVTWDFGDGTVAAGDLTATHTYTDNGVYTVTLTVDDHDGGVGSDTLTVTVANAAPTVSAGADQSADEGVDVIFNGSFADAGSGDTHTITWDFGDGSPAVSGSLSPSHKYADNGQYTVTLTVTDDDSGEGTNTLTVTVNNVAPTADAGSDATINEGGTFTSSGSFTDPGADTWTATVDYGDGFGVQALALDEDKRFALSRPRSPPWPSRCRHPDR